VAVPKVIYKLIHIFKLRVHGSLLQLLIEFCVVARVERHVFAVLLKHTCMVEKAASYAHHLHKKRLYKVNDSMFPKVLKKKKKKQEKKGGHFDLVLVILLMFLY
jgi:hypothetical protein